jgi:hypothetical protein
MSTGFILLFSYMDIKYIYHIHPFLVTTHFPLVPIPGKALFYLPVLHFFLKFVFQTCIYHALIRLPTSPHYLFFLCHHVPLLSNSLQCTVL